MILFGIIYIISIYTNLNINKILIIWILDIYFLFLSNIYISHIIFLEGLRNCIFGIIDIILIWAACFRCFKYLYYLIKDSLVFSLNIVIIIFNIIFFKLNFVFNAGVFINIFYFYIIKNTIYSI